MKTKYTLYHTGKPYGGLIPASAWSVLSRHQSVRAALKRIRRETAHLQPNTWDDHYRTIRDADAKILDQIEAQDYLRAIPDKTEVPNTGQFWYTNHRKE